MFKKTFALIFIAYLLFFVLIPPFQTPDEPEHFQNIHWFSRLVYPYLPTKNKIPSRVYVSQIYHPPLYPAAGAIIYKIGDLFGLKNIQLFYLTRLTSALFYFASVFIAYKILKSLIKDKKTINDLLIFFAINPLTIQTGIGINPDAAVFFFGLLFMLLMLKLNEKKDIPIKDIFILATVSVLTTLSKFSGIFTALSFSLFLFYKFGFNKRSLYVFFIFNFLILIFISPWLTLNYLRYGKPIIDNFSLVLKNPPAPMPLPKALFFALIEFRHTIMHFAGFFAWNMVYPPKWFFYLYTLFFVAISITGTVKIYKEKKIKMNLVMINVISLFFFLYILSLSHRLNGLPWDIQGRYLLPIFLPLTVLIFHGIKKNSKILLYFSIFHYLFSLFFVLIPGFY